jgi:hypothetical protein
MGNHYDRTTGYCFLRCVVDSVDYLEAGYSRKRMFVTYFSDRLAFSGDTATVPYRYKDVWVEGIGALYTHFFDPGTDYAWYGWPDASLLCFTESNTTLYQLEGFNTCDTVTSIATGIAAAPLTGNVTVYPNPTVDGYTNIQLTGVRDETLFSLFDLAGRMVLQKPLTGKQSRLHLADITRGMYLYNITCGDREPYSGKLIVAQ